MSARLARHRLAAVAGMVCWMCVGTSGQVRPVKTVLTIHLGPEDFPSNPILHASIRETLLAPPDVPIDYFSEYLESDRFAENGAQALADYIRQKYRGRRIDVVIPMADQVLQFVLDHRVELFPDAAIVFAGIGMPDDSVRTSGHGLSGVIVGAAYAQTLKLALDLHPSTQQVFVVAKVPEMKYVAPVRAALDVFSARVKLSYITEASLPGLLDAVRAVPDRSLILFLWHSVEDPGHLVYATEIVRLVAQAARVPVYGTSDFYVGSGVVGGVIRRTHDTGARVGQIARQIIEGTPAQDIPIEHVQLVPTFDWRQMQRWGIADSQLPAGSDIRFRVPTAWETYRWYVVGTVVVLAAQLLLITGLLVQRTRRRRAEDTIVKREATIRTSYERIRRLAGRLINAQEQARASIARDLHDGVCQELAAVSIAVETLKDSTGNIQDAAAQHTLAHVQDYTLTMGEGLRRLSHSLHPATLQLLGLAPALKGHCAEVTKQHGVQVTFTTDGNVQHVHPDVGLCLFRIAQESLRNGVQHGDARQLGVSLAASNGHIELTVTDDGRGFDLESVRRSGGLGLVSIEERAHLVDGDVQILTAPGKGTTVLVRVPTRQINTA